jgi:hypothetical protein
MNVDISDVVNRNQDIIGNGRMQRAFPAAVSECP